MTDEERTKRNQERMATLYPTFARRIDQLIKDLELRGLKPRIQDAWRSPQDQRKAYESGHSKLLYGFHNVTGPDGKPEGLAVDLLDDTVPLHPRGSYILQLAAAAAPLSLQTGVRWGLPAKLAAAIDNAIATKNWNAAVKLGWDPTHVEPSDLTVAEAKAGKRPA